MFRFTIIPGTALPSWPLHHHWTLLYIQLLLVYGCPTAETPTLDVRSAALGSNVVQDIYNNKPLFFWRRVGWICWTGHRRAKWGFDFPHWKMSVVTSNWRLIYTTMYISNVPICRRTLHCPATLWTIDPSSIPNRLATTFKFKLHEKRESISLVRSAKPHPLTGRADTTPEPIFTTLLTERLHRVATDAHTMPPTYCPPSLRIPGACPPQHSLMYVTYSGTLDSFLKSLKSACPASSLSKRRTRGPSDRCEDFGQ